MAVVWFDPVHNSRQHKHLDKHDGVLCYGHAIQPHAQHLWAFIKAGSGHSGQCDMGQHAGSPKVQQRRSDGRCHRCGSALCQNERAAAIYKTINFNTMFTAALKTYMYEQVVGAWCEDGAHGCHDRQRPYDALQGTIASQSQLLVSL